MKFLFVPKCNVCIEGGTDGQPRSFQLTSVLCACCSDHTNRDFASEGGGWGGGCGRSRVAKRMFLSDQILFIMLYKF